ncbi:MAG TPA: fibronectin type III domain-containing protein [Tepidisphaeraceae bacterium]|nr:fibronectin type III domain-containing protein [Tepidisphaeraceae bacterium]
MRFVRCIGSLLLLAGCLAAGPVHVIGADGELTFELHDPINLPFYDWPRTLLSYDIDFRSSGTRPDEYQLFDAQNGQWLPSQWSGIQGARATLNFFSDLPPGGTRRFVLRRAVHPSFVVASVLAARHGDQIDVDGGTLSVRLPASGDVPPRDLALAPIIAINRGHGAIGDNRIISPNRPVLHVDTQCIERGDLFRIYRITYTFAGGGTYEATVKIVRGYPFVELTERMSGLSQSDGAAMEMDWSNFSPTKRYPAGGFGAAVGRWMGIDQPIISPDIEEDPKWFPPNLIEDPSRDMAFRLAAFSGNGVRDATPEASFWEDAPGGSELSVFVLDTLGWREQRYGIWQPGTALQIHFRYENGVLKWRWPLVNGTRSTAIALTDAVASQKHADEFLKRYSRIAAVFGAEDQTARIADVRLRDAQLLRGWYGSLSLDRVKDWDLTYPNDARQPDVMFQANDVASPAALDKFFQSSALSLYPLGLNLVAMNIKHRQLYDYLIPGFNRFHGELTPSQRTRAVGLMLLSAYVNSGDDMAPVRICLSGCPNMSADGFCVPSEVAMLFPHHPMAAAWRDQFEKTLELMACFYTRPGVKSWDALGGRWTESLSVYNWAYLRPTQLAEYCAQITDGRNRYANEWTAMRARWMVDELTAPVHNPDPYWRQELPLRPPPSAEGMDRQYPAHGAHGSGTTIPIPPSVPILAAALERYDPMAAEHLFWAAAQASARAKAEFDWDNPWCKLQLARIPPNDGTEPELKSCKYTGHGVVLRAGVGTPEELSIHLDQIDAGPNYRWGDMGQGSCGTLFFYAAGKVWTGTERENTGDHYNEETIGQTNFGFFKDGKYRCIGANALDRPMYDLGVAQFAQLASRRESGSAGAYSWPQYDSRSVLLVGTDYFALLDRTAAQPVGAAGRFSWFQARDLPFPKLIFLKPLSARLDHWTEVQTDCSKGILRDTQGSSVVLVTHKADDVEMEDLAGKPLTNLKTIDLNEYSPRKGGRLIDGVWRIKAPHSHDVLFCNDEPIHYATDAISFDGTAGVVRRREDGATEMAIFQGSEIGAGGLALHMPVADEIGISATFSDERDIWGRFVSPRGPSQLTIDGPNISAFYIDGQRQPVVGNVVALPAGAHVWEMTDRPVRPIAPTILRTENFSGGADVDFDSVAGAEGYRLELSLDGGKTWKTAARGETSPIHLAGLQNSTKVHVRLIALNSGRESEPSAAFPIYVSDAPPLPPDGLWLTLDHNRVTASWGQVLGVAQYKLYRRKHRQSDWTVVYSGPRRQFLDDAEGVMPPDDLPGGADTAAATYDYAVACVNGNGEGAKSDIADTNPASWRNWWPAGTPMQFQRQSAYWLPPYVPADQVPPPTYPN